jgi:hypothetical protein
VVAQSAMMDLLQVTSRCDLLHGCGCCPNLDVAPPSWRLNAGWKPALHLKLGEYPAVSSLAMFDSLWDNGRPFCSRGTAAGQ